MTNVTTALEAIETWPPGEQVELAERIREKLVAQAGSRGRRRINWPKLNVALPTH